MQLIVVLYIFFGKAFCLLLHDKLRTINAHCRSHYPSRVYFSTQYTKKLPKCQIIEYKPKLIMAKIKSHTTDIQLGVHNNAYKRFNKISTIVNSITGLKRCRDSQQSFLWGFPKASRDLSCFKRMNSHRKNFVHCRF